MRVQFCHRHVRDYVVILEEGNLHHPRCPCCDMLVPWSELNKRHLVTTQCARGTERKRRRMLEEGLRESSDRAFQCYDEPLKNVIVFKYLGRVLTEGYDN